MSAEILRFPGKNTDPAAELERLCERLAEKRQAIRWLRRAAIRRGSLKLALKLLDLEGQADRLAVELDALMCGEAS